MVSKRIVFGPKKMAKESYYWKTNLNVALYNVLKIVMTFHLS